MHLANDVQAQRVMVFAIMCSQEEGILSEAILLHLQSQLKQSSQCRSFVPGRGQPCFAETNRALSTRP
jgi:hypothetical protein